MKYETNEKKMCVWTFATVQWLKADETRNL